jgi:hypothetical protein
LKDLPADRTPGRPAPYLGAGIPVRAENQTLPELLMSIRRGQYVPRPGSAGSVLVEAHPAIDPYVAIRSLAIFAKVAYRREGLWWLMAFEADHDLLATEEVAYMARCWRAWCAGVNPFRRGHVTA